MADTNKTEDATPKKRREARDKGEVARSIEISAAVNMLVGLTVVCLFAGHVLTQARQMISFTFSQFTAAPLSMAMLGELMRYALIKLMIMAAPMLFFIILAIVLANYLQIGFKIAPQAITPKLSNINPLNGVKRLFNARAFMELAKATVKVIFVIAIVWAVVKKQLPAMVLMLAAPLPTILKSVGHMIWSVIWQLGLFFLLVGVLDYFWQRYEFFKRLRMTKQEVRDEYKQQEGDMQIKSRRRSKHRRMVMTRIAAEVARADVITTNPTHYAVALRYDQNTMRAPKVVAKGENHWAKIIRRLAIKYHVPVIENKLVTRAIYKHVEVGREIPPMLYKAVAEILAALYKIRAGKGMRS
jgi:flagellar biosynthetic protein FlhB